MLVARLHNSHLVPVGWPGGYTTRFWCQSPSVHTPSERNLRQDVRQPVIWLSYARRSPLNTPNYRMGCLQIFAPKCRTKPIAPKPLWPHTFRPKTFSKTKGASSLLRLCPHLGKSPDTRGVIRSPQTLDLISKRYGMHRKTAPAPVMYWCSGPMILILHPICIHACVKTGFSNMLCTGRKVPKCRVGIENK